MTTASHSRFIFAIAILLAVPLLSNAATAVKIGIRPNWQPNAPQSHFGHTSIKVHVIDPNASEGGLPDLHSGPPLFDNQGPGTKPDFWDVTRVKGGKAKTDAPEVLTVKVITHQTGWSYDLDLPGLVAAEGDEFEVKVTSGHDPDEMLLPGFTVANKDDLVLKLTIDKGTGDFLRHIGGLATKPDFSIQEGEDNVYSLKLLAGFDDEGRNDSYWSGKALLSADIALHPKDEGRHFSKIVGELDGLYTFKFAGFEDISSEFHAREQLGISSRLESDQQFDNTNITLGITSWTAVNGRLLHDFSNLFCWFGDKPTQSPPALINLSYELVEKVNRDAESRARSIDRTTDRVRVHLLWQLLVGHKFVTLFDSPYNLALVIDSGVAYDFGNSKTAPDVNLALEFGPYLSNKSVPTFVLSYINGKTSTKFENYSEILGGLKWRW
ncbi:MAG: hypothetical protein K1X78_10230 [Verrucomicrobiaceae bacterium]|nr:hypothetical protein [Verrucomicrobiaceae bacterium]